MATITGTSGNDSLVGTTGSDTISGLGGNDTLNGNGGSDFFDGGAGFDSIDLRSTSAALVINFASGTISGGVNATFSGIERVQAGSGSDSLLGAAGAQNLAGQGGSDTLHGGAGIDTLWGGSGNDRFVFRETGSANADALGDFASGADKIELDASVMTALGASGNFSAGDGRFWAAAGANGGHDADDRIIYNTTTRQLFYDADGSGSGAAVLIATVQSGGTLAATDIVVSGGSGSGEINGTAGNDSLAGTAGNDTINGLSGNDTLNGGAGQDLLRGGDGNDYLIDDDAASDTLDGGLGDDTYEIHDHGGAHYVLADAGGIDTVISEGDFRLPDGIEHLTLRGTFGGVYGVGNALNNRIVIETQIFVTQFVDGADGDDSLVGGGWQDVFGFNEGSGNYGNDSVVGGGDWDEMDFGGARSAIVANMRRGTVDGGGTGGSGSVRFTGIEEITGGAFDDELIAHDGVWLDDEEGNFFFTGAELWGGEGNDTLNGGAANDALWGEAGHDRISGSRGNDWLRGGAGNDQFVFAATGEDHADSVADFVSGADKIILDASGIAGLGLSGNFSVGDERFHAGAAAHDSSDRVIWDGNTLWYDPDGSGAQAMRRIADVGGTLAATDIAVENGNVPGSIIPGTAGNDTLVGTEGNDTLDGMGGNDRLRGESGDDVLLGGAGNDSIDGNLGADSMVGGDGNDTLDGLWGRSDEYEWETDWDWENNQPLPGGDTLNGGLGDDHYYLGRNDTIIDTGGFDTVHAEHDYTLQAELENLLYEPYPDSDGEGLFVQFGGNELDNFIEITYLWENSGSVVDGGAGNDTLWGGGGTSTFRFSLALDDYGHDELHGTRIDFEDARSAIVVDLMAGTMVGGGTGGSGSATLFGVYDVYGGEFDDHIIGGDSGGGWGYPQLAGGGGNDTLEGGTGLTYLWGDEGDDRLISHDRDFMQGGEGTDTFVFSRVPVAPDPFYAYYGAIDDFATGIDAIRLDAAFHSGIGSSGRFTVGDERFHAAAGATEGHDATDRVIYDTSTGMLYYDADGDGSAAASIIVDLGAGTALVASDIGVERESADLVLAGTQGNDSLAGGGGSDTIDGGGGDDSLSGGDGADSIRGGDGNDTLDGGADPDSMDGGSGDDTYYVTAGDQLVDADGHDLVLAVDNWTLGEDFEDLTVTSSGNPYGYVSGFGNELANVVRANATTRVNLSGNGGDDTLYGGPAAQASLHGGNGHDVLNGTDGGDWISGDAGNDSIAAGAGDDGIDVFGSAFDGNYGHDTVDGGAGADQLDFSDDWAAKSGVTVDLAAGSASGGGPLGAGRVTFTGIEQVFGTPFADSISGDGGANELLGSQGNDTIAGGAGNDTLFGDWSLPEYGTLGADTFVLAHYGAAHADLITDFRSGYDKIALDASVFTAIGASGNFSSGDARFAANSTGTAQDANDRIIFDTSTARLYYDADGNGVGASQHFATTTIFYGVPAATDFVVVGTAPATGQLINGTSGNDTLAGTAGNDTINGLGGNDLIQQGSGGNDVVDGGAGTDSIEFKAAATGALVVNFATGSIAGSGGSIAFTSIERVVAGNFNDSLSGAAGAQNLAGQAGADTLTGGAGIDTLWGGTGNDAFVFNGMGTANADRISDFAAGQDKVQLEDAAFTAIGATGNFSSGDARFWASSTGTAHDANDRVLYNTTTGQLYYDADGNGGGAAQLFATLSTRPVIAATDIAVI